MNPVLELTEALVRRESVTPNDAGCQSLLAERLEALGFSCEFLHYGDVSNLYARRGKAAPLLLLLGHTDVVPTGPVEEWSSPPFKPTQREGLLFGRGTADMKGSLAAMIVALERIFAADIATRGSVAFLTTSDEEGAAINGVRRVMQTFAERGEQIDYCLVGEPSSHRRLGDTLRIGRRGSLNVTIQINGMQGHVAYPQLADNPLHRFAPALAELVATEWDEGTEHFPPTSFQVSNLRSGTGAANVIPGELIAQANFRYCPESSAQSLQARVEAVLTAHGLDYECDWALSGKPFFTSGGALIDAAVDATKKETGLAPVLDTGGGTSDGRFVAPTGAQVVELGPVNASIHKIDEHVAVDSLEPLARIYERIIRRLIL